MRDGAPILPPIVQIGASSCGAKRQGPRKAAFVADVGRRNGTDIGACASTVVMKFLRSERWFSVECDAGRDECHQSRDISAACETRTVSPCHTSGAKCGRSSVANIAR